jgi:probable HAF family extracellular repeat protein
LFCAVPAAQGAQFTSLGYLPGGGPYSAGYGVSGDGSTVVGVARNALGAAEAIQYDDDGGLVALGGTKARGVSADGTVIVGAREVPTWNDSYEACYWTASSGLTPLGELPGGDQASFAHDASLDGMVVVGWSKSDGGIAGDFVTEAFRWTQATGLLALGDLAGGAFYSQARGVSDDGSVIVGFGSSDAGPSSEAFRWTEAGGMVGLGGLEPGNVESAAYGVSPDGATVVGWSRTAMGQEAFRWTEAEGMIGLGDLPGGADRSAAFGVSADGAQIVGASSSAAVPADEAFIWDSTHGMRSLLQVLIDDYQLDLEDWTLTRAWGISADGSTVVGEGINPQGQREGWVARMPEPASLADLTPASASAATKRQHR